MTVQELEKALRRRSLRRRIIMGVLFVALVIVNVVLSNWLEAGRSVAYAWSLTVTILLPFLLMFDTIFCRFATVDVGGGHSLTVYRGCFSGTVYVDGTARDSTWLSKYNSLAVEVRLPDGVKAVVCFSRTVFYLAQIFYSDGSESVEV